MSTHSNTVLLRSTDNPVVGHWKTAGDLLSMGATELGDKTSIVIPSSTATTRYTAVEVLGPKPVAKMAVPVAPTLSRSAALQAARRTRARWEEEEKATRAGGLCGSCGDERRHWTLREVVHDPRYQALLKDVEGLQAAEVLRTFSPDVMMFCLEAGLSREQIRRMQNQLRSMLEVYPVKHWNAKSHSVTGLPHALSAPDVADYDNFRATGLSVCNLWFCARIFCCCGRTGTVGRVMCAASFKNVIAMLVLSVVILMGGLLQYPGMLPTHLDARQLWDISKGLCYYRPSIAAQATYQMMHDEFDMELAHQNALWWMNVSSDLYEQAERTYQGGYPTDSTVWPSPREDGLLSDDLNAQRDRLQAIQRQGCETCALKWPWIRLGVMPDPVCESAACSIGNMPLVKSFNNSLRAKLGRLREWMGVAESNNASAWAQLVGNVSSTNMPDKETVLLYAKMFSDKDVLFSMLPNSYQSKLNAARDRSAEEANSVESRAVDFLAEKQADYGPTIRTIVQWFIDRIQQANAIFLFVRVVFLWLPNPLRLSSEPAFVRLTSLLGHFNNWVFILVYLIISLLFQGFLWILQYIPDIEWPDIFFFFQLVWVDPCVFDPRYVKMVAVEIAEGCQTLAQYKNLYSMARKDFDYNQAVELTYRVASALIYATPRGAAAHVYPSRGGCGVLSVTKFARKVLTSITAPHLDLSNIMRLIGTLLSPFAVLTVTMFLSSLIMFLVPYTANAMLVYIPLDMPPEQAEIIQKRYAPRMMFVARTKHAVLTVLWFLPTLCIFWAAVAQWVSPAI